MAAEIKRTNGKYEVRLRKGSVELQKLSLPCAGEATMAPVTIRPGQFLERPEVAAAEPDVLCVELTPNFLICGTDSGAILYLYLDDLAGPCLANEHRHSEGGITRLWPNNNGTRLLFEDSRHSVHLYNPLDDQKILVTFPKDDGILEAALWDINDPHVFVLSTPSQILVYIYSPLSVHCSKVTFLQATAIPFTSTPFTLQNGLLSCKVLEDQQDIAAQDTVVMPTHTLLKRSPDGKDLSKERFDQALLLLRFEDALEDAKLLKCPTVWNKLITKALEHMDLKIAMKACQLSRNIRISMSLRKVEQMEEYYLLAGHLLLLLGNFDAAEELFLKSTDREAAVRMRRDLEHWGQAMTIAKSLKSHLAIEILKDYARSLELRGDYREALAHYEEFLRSGPTNPQQKLSCQAGIARASIHLGDIWKGKQLAKDCNDSRLYNECANILKGLNLHEDAAEIHELNGHLEEAVSIYIFLNNHSRALSLLEKLASPKFYLMYAKALEKQRKLTEAASAYMSAEEHESAVRLYLGPLKRPSEAFAIVRRTRSLEGASMASKYCKKIGDYENAIEFLILQKRTQEARELAQQQDKMDFYTERVANVASKEECLKLARYYESITNPEKAANMFERCGEPKQALSLYLSWGSAEALEKAIAMVGRIRDDTLTGQLLEFLMGEMNVKDKDPHYLYKLHMVLANYELATKEALLIAQQEQEMGNYKAAHQQLLDVCKVLRGEKRKLPLELLRQLTLLHSYMLVKTLVRLGDHRSSARLLIRVARHISKFPAHVIPILISTVIECQRSGLKKTAFEYASVLMRPEYRNQITGPCKRKIENIVRKPERVDEDEESSPCPYCFQLVPDTQLECSACKNYLPFCIASGRHMVVGNWTKCPSCQFSALLTEFREMIKRERACPMCSSEVAAEDIVEVADPSEELNPKDKKDDLVEA